MPQVLLSGLVSAVPHPVSVEGGRLMIEKVRNSVRRQLALRFTRDLVEVPGSGPRVSFTFDDFLLSSATLGAEILERHDVRGTFYVNGGIISAQSDLGPTATLEDLHRLHAAGHEIGCHGYSHRNAFDLSPAQLLSELDRNAAFFAQALPGVSVCTHAYPYGAVSLSSKALAISRFKGCRGIVPGINERYIDRGLILACPLESWRNNHDDIIELIREAVRRDGWLVFFSHDVSDHPTQFGVTPRDLDWVLSETISAGCRVETMERVLAG